MYEPVEDAEGFAETWQRIMLEIDLDGQSMEATLMEIYA